MTILIKIHYYLIRKMTVKNLNQFQIIWTIFPKIRIRIFTIRWERWYATDYYQFIVLRKQNKMVSKIQTGKQVWVLLKSPFPPWIRVHSRTFYSASVIYLLSYCGFILSLHWDTLIGISWKPWTLFLDSPGLPIQWTLIVEIKYWFTDSLLS